MRQYGHILTKNEERIPKKGLKHVSKGTMPKGETENKMGKTGDKRHHTEGRKKVCDLYRSPSTVWIEKSIWLQLAKCVADGTTAYTAPDRTLLAKQVGRIPSYDNRKT